MHLHDSNARSQIARERADELARDWRQAQNAAVPEPRQAEQVELATPASLLDRLLRRRPVQAAAQRP
jgi:hypothetical protein